MERLEEAEDDDDVVVDEVISAVASHSIADGKEAKKRRKFPDQRPLDGCCLSFVLDDSCWWQWHTG